MKYYFNPISKLHPKVKAFILSEKIYVRKKKSERDYSAKECS